MRILCASLVFGTGEKRKPVLLFEEDYMIRYLRVDKAESEKEFDRKAQIELSDPVLCLDEKPMDTPYLKLEIKIIEKEMRYSMDRKGDEKPPKKRRWPWQK